MRRPRLRHGGLQHEAVHAAPEDVETQRATHFRVLQDNAEKFQHNKELTEGRQRRLQQASAFRTPTNASQSPAQLQGLRAGRLRLQVRATDGTQTLLKHALAVPRGSGEPVQRLTGVPQAVRQLRDFNPLPKGGGSLLGGVRTGGRWAGRWGRAGSRAGDASKPSKVSSLAARRARAGRRAAPDGRFGRRRAESRTESSVNKCLILAGLQPWKRIWALDAFHTVKSVKWRYLSGLLFRKEFGGVTSL